MLVGLTQKQWRALCDAMHLGEAMSHLSTELGLNLDEEGERFRARQRIADLIAPWIAARSFTDIQSAFDKHGVCWGRYQTVGQLVQADPACTQANPMFSALEQPGVGRYLMPGIPLDFSAVARAPAAPAPMLGQHTEEVLLDVLGLSAGEFGRLHDKGVRWGLVHLFLLI
jgi:2-methylfumaryl-CoA isomerase